MENKNTSSFESLLFFVKTNSKKQLILQALLPEQQNSIETFKSQNGTFIFYPYNSESIRDYGWGCAWRCIQSIINTHLMNNSSPILSITFEDLFNYFGQKEILLILYCKLHSKEFDKKKYESLVEAKFAPHELESGWAEPFIGYLCLDYFNMNSDLFLINGLPDFHNTPKEMFENIVSFKEFIQMLLDKLKLPVMIDDGIYALTILEVKIKEKGFKLSIGDPHVNEKTLKGSCFYDVDLDESGRQIANSIDEEQKKQMYSKGSYQGIHFNEKHWMVLFPY